MKVLDIAAHPDDLDFTCAGTLAKLVKEGKEVFYLIVTNGEKGTLKIKSKSKLVKIREKEQRNAAKVIGAKDVFFLRERDSEVENTKELRRKIVKVIRQVKPDVIFAFDPANKSFDNFYRFHRDHRIVGEAAFDSIYPAAGSDAYFKDLIKQGYKPHIIKEAWFFSTDKPNVYVDISSTINKKLEALKQHKSQMWNFNEVEDLVKSRARELGKKAKMKYAEGFRKVILD